MSHILFFAGRPRRPPTLRKLTYICSEELVSFFFAGRPRRPPMLRELVCIVCICSEASSEFYFVLFYLILSYFALLNLI
jgi:hypothetical protein